MLKHLLSETGGGVSTTKAKRSFPRQKSTENCWKTQQTTKWSVFFMWVLFKLFKTHEKNTERALNFLGTERPRLSKHKTGRKIVKIKWNQPKKHQKVANLNSNVHVLKVKICKQTCVKNSKYLLWMDLIFPPLVENLEESRRKSIGNIGSGRRVVEMHAKVARGF